MLWFHVCLLMFKPQALFDALTPGDRKPEGDVHSICLGPQPERPLDHRGRTQGGGLLGTREGTRTVLAITILSDVGADGKRTDVSTAEV